MRVTRYDNIITKEIRDKISSRYKRITRAINREFWKIENETSNSLYVGSYGRNTAISTSDIDILIKLPREIFNSFNRLTDNGQSRLLQTVRNAIKTTYANSDIRADGQIVKINFSDGIQFEILPAIESRNGTFVYPDSNMGGNWKSTNPKAEQEAIKAKNRTSDGLLVSTCRHMRYIRDTYFKSYYLSGIVIDSFVFHAIGSWRFAKESTGASTPGTYEKNLLKYYNENKNFWNFLPLRAPGSEDELSTQKSIECLEKVLKYMQI